MKHIKRFNESIEGDIKNYANTILADYLRDTNSYFNFYRDGNKLVFYLNKLSYDYRDSDGQRHYLPDEPIWFMDWKDDLIQFF